MKIEQNSILSLPNSDFLRKENIDKSKFEKLLEPIKELNETQIEAREKMTDVLVGKSDDTHGAMIALEKSQIQMQLAVTIKDKLTQGYQQIMNMQI